MNNTIKEFWHTTWKVWQTGVLSQFYSELEKAAAVGFSEFIRTCTEVEHPAMKTFLSQFTPLPMEFLICFDDIHENKPTFVLTSQRLVIRKKEDATYVSFMLSEIAEVVLTGFWRVSLKLLMHNGESYVFYVHNTLSYEVLNFTIKEAHSNDAWKNIEAKLSASPIHETDETLEEPETHKADSKSEISVCVPNVALDLSEKVAQMSPMMGDEMIRSATLRFSDNRLQLLVPHYFDEPESELIGELPGESVKCFSVKGKVNKRMQSAQGFIKGASFAAGGFIFFWIFYNDKIAVSVGTFILIAIIAIIFCSIVYGLFSISRTEYAIVSIEGTDGIDLAFCIKENQLESLLDWARNKGFAISKE